MKVTFLGAAHEVTGSCTLLTVGEHPLLIDCGMEQGRDLFENQQLPVAASTVEAVLLTHAHIDHSGLIPLLYAQGFRGKVFCTPATARLCDIMLRDSAHIQEFEAEWRNRKAKRSGEAPYEPIYTTADAVNVLRQFVPVEYGVTTEIVPGCTVTFTDAGHLLGSASLTLVLTENGEQRTVVFSGDIGNVNKPILCDPQLLKTADYVVMESTYGNRSHEAGMPNYTQELAEVIQRTFDRGGNVVIPSFAVGRTQELLYFLREVKEQNLVTGHGEFPVVIDSPLAIEATKVFDRTARSCYDKDMLAVLDRGVDPIVFPGLYTAVSADESRLINEDTRSKVIISASGMCDAGRVRHHLKHNLWRAESTILFVGYQTEGTVGHTLLDGAKTVKLFGETVAVHAEIVKLKNVSGHADDEGLLRWAAAFEPKPRRIFVNHGDEFSCETLTDRLCREQQQTAVAPYSGDEWDLLTDLQVAYGSRKRAERGNRGNTNRNEAVYQRLVAAVQRLVALVNHSRGRANKDLARLTEQIRNLCDKWEK